MKYLLLALLLAAPLGAQSEPDMSIPQEKPLTKQSCAKPYKMYYVLSESGFAVSSGGSNGTYGTYYPPNYPVCLKPEFFSKLKEAYEASVR